MTNRDVLHQGDLQDANYFDFISFAQVGAKPICPPWLVPETFCLCTCSTWSTMSTSPAPSLGSLA